METINKKVDSEDCLTLRVSCQDVMSEKRKGIADSLDLRFGAITDKLDLIIDRQAQVISRIDAHINGHGHK